MTGTSNSTPTTVASAGAGPRDDLGRYHLNLRWLSRGLSGRRASGSRIAQTGWIDFVIKPAVAASAEGAMRFDCRQMDAALALRRWKGWTPSRFEIGPYFRGIELGMLCGHKADHECSRPICDSHCRGDAFRADGDANRGRNGHGAGRSSGSNDGKGSLCGHEECRHEKQ